MLCPFQILRLFAITRVPHSTLYVALLVLGVSYLVNVLSHGFLSSWLALIPELVRSGQWWRMLSYPLALRNFFDMAATGIVLYLFAADFERSLGTARLWRFAVLVLLTNGILYTIVLYAVPIPLENCGCWSLVLASFPDYFSLPQRPLCCSTSSQFTASALLLASSCTCSPHHRKSPQHWLQTTLLTGNYDGSISRKR